MKCTIGNWKSTPWVCSSEIAVSRHQRRQSNRVTPNPFPLTINPQPPLNKWPPPHHTTCSTIYTLYILWPIPYTLYDDDTYSLPIFTRHTFIVIAFWSPTRIEIICSAMKRSEIASINPIQTKPIQSDPIHSICHWNGWPLNQMVLSSMESVWWCWYLYIECLQNVIWPHPITDQVM